jgi:hypothetical protein
MFAQFLSSLRWGSLVILLAMQVACTASPARKVECDSNLRPINQATLEHQKP